MGPGDYTQIVRLEASAFTTEPSLGVGMGRIRICVFTHAQYTRGQTAEFFPPFHHVNLGHCTWIIRLNFKYLYPLGYLNGPRLYFRRSFGFRAK